MSPSPSSSQVNLTSEQEASLLTPTSTVRNSSLSDDDAHPHGKMHYTQLPMSGKEQVVLRDSLRPARFSLGPWLYELLSLSLSFVAIGFLVLLLGMYDKQPNPPWAAHVSLNTIVSIVSVLFRAFIMVPVTKCISQQSWVWLAKAERPLEDVALFDRASRGVSGGLAILASSRHVISFVSLGAILTVVMLAVGPCFQQTVVYYGARVVDDTSSAYTSAAFGYNGSVGYYTENYTTPGYQLPFNMKSAVYTGLLSSKMIHKPDPLFSCPSGNCTWDSFDTLAVGVQCINAPQRTNLECHTNPDPSAYRGTRCAFTRNESMLQDMSSSILPPFPSLNSSTSLATRLTTPFFFGSLYADSTPDSDASVWTHHAFGRLDLEWVRATDLLSTDDRMWHDISRNSSIESGMCKLYTVLHKVSAKVENEVYKEEIEQVSTNTEDSSGAFNFKYQDGSSPSAKISITKRQNMVLLQGVQYLIDRGTVSVSTYDFLEGTEVAKMLYQSRNITESIYSLAHYMSIALRSNDTILRNQEHGGDTTKRSSTYIAPTHRVKGTVYIEKIHVAVRWVWLTLPILVALLNSLLLAITILESYIQRVGIWKDSPLALLLYSELNPGSRQNSAPARSIEAIERDARGLGAVLVHREDEERGVKGSVKVHRC